jgi:hypothetical protein
MHVHASGHSSRFADRPRRCRIQHDGASQRGIAYLEPFSQ